MKKVIKILVLVLSVGIIAFSVMKMVNPDLPTFGDNGDDDGDYTKIAEVFVDETEGGCELEIYVCKNNKVNVSATSTSKYGDLVSTNSYFPIEQFYDCQYDDDIIFWMIQYGADNDHFASIVPDDCVGAKIGGIMYKSETGEIQIGNETVSFKYVLTDLEHIDMDNDNRLVALIDEKGIPHTDFLNNLEEMMFNIYRKLFLPHG